MIEKMMQLYRILVDRMENFDQRLERLESVQGPEQGLVGEARSDSETGHAEEAKPGERGVGEIVELAELRRRIQRKIREARREEHVANDMDNRIMANFYCGKVTALVDLCQDFERMAEKRSDLSNAELRDRHLKQTPPEKENVQ